MDKLERTAAPPFLMRGCIDGTPVERPAYSTEQAEHFAQLAADSGTDSWGSWMVLTGTEHAGAKPIVLFARHRRGLVGETRRQVHAIGISPGRLLAPTLTAACGIVLSRSQVEFLALVEGQPCERCVARLPVDNTASTDVTPELPGLHPEVAALLAELGHTSVSLPHRGPLEPSPAAQPAQPLAPGGLPARRVPGTHLPTEAYTGPIPWPLEDPDNPSSRFALMTRTLEGLHRYTPPTDPRNAATTGFRGWMQPPEGNGQSPTDPRM